MYYIGIDARCYWHYAEARLTYTMTFDNYIDVYRERNLEKHKLYLLRQREHLNLKILKISINLSSRTPWITKYIQDGSWKHNDMVSVCILGLSWFVTIIGYLEVNVVQSLLSRIDLLFISISYYYILTHFARLCK